MNGSPRRLGKPYGQNVSWTRLNSSMMNRLSMRPVVLGSRSPRRQELLQLLVPRDQIIIKPPRTSEEAGFENLSQPADIAQRLCDIVEAKRKDVHEQLTLEEKTNGVALVADTIIVALNAHGSYTVLGQPPEPDWRSSVRDWFLNYYSGRTHQAWTGLCLWNDAGILISTTVTTTVVFHEVSPAEIDWYLATEESRGKAGGYALQGLASVFIRRVEGSLSNVVGLPLEVLKQVLPQENSP